MHHASTARLDAAYFPPTQIDTGSLYNGLDFADAKLRVLTAALAPAFIRIGGTAVDTSFYFPQEPYNVGVPNPCDACGSGAAAIGDVMLDNIFDFITATNMSLLWDFNGERFRNVHGAWNPTGNATAMLTYLQSKHGGTVDYAWSVGNEVSSWRVVAEFILLSVKPLLRLL